MRFSANSKPGFTLVELLVSIAIIGILTSIVFVSFANQRERDSVKAAVAQAQIDLQDMQSNAQSGVLTGASLPAGYGMWFRVGSSPSATNPVYKLNYMMFADLPGDTANSWDTNDSTIALKALPQDVEVVGITDGDDNVASVVHAVYQVPNGNVVLTFLPLANPNTSKATITFKQTKANLCYSISIIGDSGTVNRRQLATCP